MSATVTSQAERLLSSVQLAAGGPAFGQLTPTEYVRSRHARNGQGCDAGACADTVQGRWTGMRVGASLQEGGFFREASGFVRIRRREFADGYEPRRGDMVRVWSADGSERWWQVTEVTSPPPWWIDGEWRLGLSAPEQ
ncbi:MAG: hypothetical protein OEY69_07870 [Candidatus Krumholzibacteria bacterium]|nr:hypothetical protein [Candidatus Krumholzibacteria bacterium]